MVYWARPGRGNRVDMCSQPAAGSEFATEGGLMSARVRRSRGAQVGNRNALKHGFYSKMAPTSRKEDFLTPEARAGEIERDIAIARKNIRSLLEKDPGNERLLYNHVSMLQRLIRTHQLLSQRLNQKQRHALQDFGPGLSFVSGPNRGRQP